MGSKGAVLVVGVDGRVGSALSNRLLQSGRQVLGTTRRQGTEGPSRVFLDLATQVDSWVPPEQVETGFLCAGISGLLPCERDPLGTSQINVRGTLAVARGLVAQGSHVLFLSTNQVFDGDSPSRRSDEPVGPRSVYGRTKAEAEAGLLALPGDVVVVRFGKILEAGPSFLSGWADDLRGGKPIRPLRDLVIAPVSTRFAVDVLLRVADRRARGTVQVSADRDVSYEEIARHIAQRVGAPQGLVQAGHSRDAGFPQDLVPRHTTFDTSRLRGELGLTPPDVWDTIDEVVGM